MLLKRLSALGLSFALAMSVGLQSKAADLGDVEDPIKLAIFEWTGQHVTTHIAGHILRKMGYEVEYVTAGYHPSASGVVDGTISASLELWDNNLGDFYPSLIREGKIEYLDDVGLDAREGWLYPKHMEKVCPGLPAWDALLSCSDKFATAETFPKGRFLEYPPDWGTRSTDLISNEGLNFTPVPSGSEGALVAEMKSAIDAETPLIMMFWAPHWLLPTIDAEWIDMPKELQDKYSLVPPSLFNVAWPGMKDKWPAAYEFLKDYKITNAIQEPIMGAVDNDGADMIKLTKEWVDSNEDYWRPMVAQAMN